MSTTHEASVDIFIQILGLVEALCDHDIHDVIAESDMKLFRQHSATTLAIMARYDWDAEWLADFMHQLK